jgi:NADH:ubiquinone oxidoreductase subunit F (NADH-binding)
MQKCYLAMELPHPVIIGILIFFKTFNLGSFENYIYIMQEAKKSMSSLNLVFFYPLYK